MKEKAFKKRSIRRLFSVVIALAMVATLAQMNSLTVYAAEAENGWTTDSHGLMEYKHYSSYGDSYYEVRGSVGEKWYSANCFSPYRAYILGAEHIEVINCDPIFINNGQQIDLVYTVKNDGSSTEQYSFNVWADTMVAGNDASKNSVNEDRSMLTMTCERGVASNDTENDIIFFVMSNANSGAQFKGAYLSEDFRSDPVNYQENLENRDSAFVGYWPQAELAPGATAEYHLIVGLTDADSFDKVIGGTDTWNYEVDGASIIATCKGECGTEGAHTATLTLEASDTIYSGSAVAAKYGDKEVEAWKEATEIPAPVIAYQQKVGNEWKAMKEGTAPTAVGAYRALAKITVDETDYIAYKEYSINPITIKEVEFTTPKVEVNTAAAATVDGIPKEAKYTGTISWSPADGKFKYDTAYTATVTLTAADNYEFAKEVSIPDGWTKDKSSTATKLVLTKTYSKIEEEKKPEVEKVPAVTVSYQTHIQTYGDSQGYKKNGEVAGTTGKSKRLEAIKIKVAGNSNVQVAYTTHVQTIGWLPWSNNNELSGTTGEAKRMEAIKIQLKGADADKYDVYYRVHSQTYGWLAWAKNGQPAGTAGLAKRLEGIQVVVVEKGKAVDKNLGGIKSTNDKAYIEGTTKTSDSEKYVNEVPNVLYKTHVQTFGWQNWKANGSVAGTTGLYKRIEGIQIKLTNCAYEGGIQYMTHVQTAGWDKKWNADGALAGTTGISKRLEGIRIELTGEMAKHYDVYYRAHSQTYGWLGWAKNGESAGSEGHKKRLEGIQIVLVEKGGKAPANNYGGVISKTSKSFIK